MVKPDAPRTGKAFSLGRITGILLFYALIPLLLACLLAKPMSDAVRRSDAAAFGILAAAAGTVCLNWVVYRILKRRHPPLPVFSHGVLCMLTSVIIQHEALSGHYVLAPILAMFEVTLAMAALLMISFWLAARPSRPAHAASVVIRAVLGAGLAAMGYQVIRDFECGNVTGDTWLTLVVFTGFIAAFNSRKIHAAVRRAAEKRRHTGLAEGRIVQMIGETYLDRDDDLATRYYARILFAVNGAEYETQAGIDRRLIRRYGREVFIGREVRVFYDPADPADAFGDKIDRRLLENDPPGEEEEQPEPISRPGTE